MRNVSLNTGLQSYSIFHYYYGDYNSQMQQEKVLKVCQIVTPIGQKGASDFLFGTDLVFLNQRAEIKKKMNLKWTSCPLYEGCGWVANCIWISDALESIAWSSTIFLRSTNGYVHACIAWLTILVMSSLNVCTGNLKDTTQLCQPDAILNCQSLLSYVM